MIYFVSTQVSEHMMLNIQHNIGRRRQNEIMAKIQAAVIQVPKPPPKRVVKAIEAKAFLKKKREAEVIITHFLLMLKYINLQNI